MNKPPVLGLILLLVLSSTTHALPSSHRFASASEGLRAANTTYSVPGSSLNANPSWRRGFSSLGTSLALLGAALTLFGSMRWNGRK